MEQQPREKVVKRRKSVLVYDNNQEPVDGQLIVRVATISERKLASENNPELRQQFKASACDRQLRSPMSPHLVLGTASAPKKKIVADRSRRK